MNSRDFCYWLQGMFELGKPTEINAETTELIKRHLAMVFIHEIDPSFPDDQQEKLDAAHSGGATSVVPGSPLFPGRKEGMRC